MVELFGEIRVQKLLNEFVCKKNPDVVNFLKEKALKFSQINKTRTYLIFDADDEEKQVKAVISITLRELKLASDVSNNTRKKFDGYMGKRNRKPISEFPAYLIGQLARDDNCDKNDLTGAELLEKAEDIIISAMELVGGRIVIVDCVDQLISFYENNGYKQLNDLISDELKLNTMYKLFEY